MDLNASAKNIRDFWVHFEGIFAKAVFLGDSAEEFEEARELLITEMKGRGFECILSGEGIIYFKRKKAS